MAVGCDYCNGSELDHETGCVRLPPPPPSDAGERDRALVRAVDEAWREWQCCADTGWEAEAERKRDDHAAIIATVNATHPPDAALAQMTAERDEKGRHLADAEELIQRLMSERDEVQRERDAAQGEARDVKGKLAALVYAVQQFIASDDPPMEYGGCFSDCEPASHSVACVAHTRAWNGLHAALSGATRIRNPEGSR